jgi:hypothetical protein
MSMSDATPPQTDAQVAQAAIAAQGMSPRMRDMGVVLMSLAITVGFIGVVFALFFRAIPPESKDMANILFGNLATMQGAVVGYWIGSSSGSAVKDGRKQ